MYRQSTQLSITGLFFRVGMSHIHKTCHISAALTLRDDFQRCLLNGPFTFQDAMKVTAAIALYSHWWRHEWCQWFWNSWVGSASQINLFPWWRALFKTLANICSKKRTKNKKTNKQQKTHNPPPQTAIKKRK